MAGLFSNPAQSSVATSKSVDSPENKIITELSGNFGTEKTMTTRDVTGFYAFFPGQFSPHFGAISLLNYTVNLEKNEKVHWRKFKKPSGDGAPKLQISVPCRARTRPETLTLLSLFVFSCFFRFPISFAFLCWRLLDLPPLQT